MPNLRHPIGRNSNILWPLFWVSLAALFIEVMLIRWIGTEVRIFAFFQNLTLVACFLGFGLGCYGFGRRKELLLSLASMAALVTLVEAPFRPWKQFLALLSSLVSLSPDAVLWGLGFIPGGGSHFLIVGASFVTVAVFLLLLVGVMIPMGQWVGSFLDAAENPVAAYSVNLLGSVAGVWIFAGMAFAWLPPEYWFAAGFVVLLLIRRPSWRAGVLGLVLLAASLILIRRRPEGVETYWSPYQKLEVVHLGEREYTIQVNNVGYMTIANMTPEFLSRHVVVAQAYRDRSSYDAPYRFAWSVDRVLIVGAGAGNDAAAALRSGAAQVDAVEIDPVIYRLGESLHPDQPYRSPRVRLIVNDARAFLRRAREKYDVIIFGLLDSHTQFSDYSNMRIDNYVYTQESFREARRLLKPKGILVVKFEVRPPWTWLGERFYGMLDHIFGRPPVVFYTPWLGHLASATVFVASDDPDLWARASGPVLGSLVASSSPPFQPSLDEAPPPTTDDWPYVYHRGHSIPKTFLFVSLMLLAMAVLMVGRVLEPRRVSTWHFFFLGAGFLLLETQLVSRLALYFGTTWLVNCFALTAILLTLVAANVHLSRRRPARLAPYYGLLVAGLLANYFFPWQRLPYAAATVGVLLSAAYAVPVFAAGVVFTEMFRRSERKSNAFGANIVGAVAGGLAQNVSFIVGMKMLLLAAAVFYVAAGLCSLRLARRAATGGP